MRRVAVAALACAALLAGCGGSDGGGGGYGGAPVTSPPPAPARGGTIAVAIRDFAFSPERVDARVGQTVRWTNGDNVDHNVTAAGFRSPNFGQGRSYQRTLTRRGTITYVCTIHPQMRGRIVVG